MQFRRKLYLLTSLIIVIITPAEPSIAFSSWEVINVSGYRIHYSANDIEYALNLSSDIEIIFNKTTDLAGYRPSAPLNIYLTEKNFKNNLAVIVKNIFDQNKIILFVDDDYNSSISRIWDFTVTKVLEEMNWRGSGFSLFKYSSMESWVPVTLSVYLREGLRFGDVMVLKSILLNGTSLSLKPALQNNYSKAEIEALYRGFIFFVEELYGDSVLTAALRNTSYYGGFVKALVSIINQDRKEIEKDFNRFFKSKNRGISKDEIIFSDKLEFIDHSQFRIISSNDKGEILVLDKLHKSIEFLKFDNESDSVMSDLNNYKKISSIPFDFPDESIQGAFFDNSTAVISVLEDRGTSFYFVNYKENIIEKNFFIPYLYIRELSHSHFPDSLLFSAAQGRRKDIYILNSDSMSIKKITESRGEYSSPAVYSKDNILFLENSDKSRIYKYDFMENKTVLLWETDGVLRDLTVSKSGDIYFSWNKNDTFNIYRFDINGKSAVQLTYFNTGAFNPLFYSYNKIIINSYIDRELKNAILNQ
jgi:hypothetical protein